MKTEIINKEQEAEWEFPCLGKMDDMVVLFRAYGVGTVIMHATSNDEIGEYDEDWEMRYFTPLKGETTIKFTK